nr:MAG TPA: hypothetical protein [Crassvirales sp.]
MFCFYITINQGCKITAFKEYLKGLFYLLMFYF